MPDRLLEVGISAIHGNGKGGLDEDAAQGLVRRALRSVDTRRLPARCAILLATADWCGPESDLPQKVRQQLEAQLAYPVPLIGGSMAAIYCSTEPTPVIKQGLSLVILCSEAMWVSVGRVRSPYSPTTDRERKLTELAKKLEEEAGDRLGSSAERYLFGFLPGVVSDERGQSGYYDNELCQDILGAFGHRYRLIGAAAADGLNPAIGYQFADDECLTSGIAMALVQSDIGTGSMLASGLEPCANLRVSVDALAGDAQSGYEVTILDGKPAAERLRELQNTGMGRLDQPVFGLPCGPDFHAIWPVVNSKQTEGSIRLKRQVTLGDRLYVLTGSPEQLLKAGQSALGTALARSHHGVDNLILILGFSCVGRLNYYGAQNTDLLASLDRLRSDYPGIPLVGGLSAGEFGIDRWRRARSNNISVSVICLTDQPSRRARTRTLQKELIAAASRLSTHDAPQRVMQSALEGAVEAGATGGQICLVDNNVGRIVGEGFGHALQPRLSPQNWEAVAKMTDRAISEPGGTFPIHLRDLSMSAVSDLPFRLEFRSASGTCDGGNEDILTLVVRTLQAVFVPNSQVQGFCCNPEACAAGNIICQLAIPLVGSAQKVIATLQVSFPDGTRLDRESFAIWLGYAQKVAGALERAQEAEERGINENLSNYRNDIMNEAVVQGSSPVDWCNHYLAMLVRLIGADGAHIRLLESTGDGDELHLVAAHGCLAEILGRTRPIIRERDGVSSVDLLKKGGKVSNTSEETAKHNLVVKAVENAEEYGPALARRLSELEGTAWLPLNGQQRLLGSLVIYSKRRYFFTERIERIVRAAADLAGTILLAKTAEHNEALLDDERDWMLQTLASATGGSAEEVLRSLVERVCVAVGADVASLFAWHGMAQKLVLHIGFNWFIPMEGRAMYGLGDGWTGSVAANGDEVSIVAPTSPDAKLCTKRYYDAMVPPEHSVTRDESEARIGVRLSAGKVLVGVLTLNYHREHRDRLVANDQRIKDFLRAITSLITLGLEVAKRDALRERMNQLVGSEERFVNLLLQDPQKLVDELREWLNVERVTFYRVGRDMRIQLAWAAQSSDIVTLGPVKSAEPLGLMADVVVRKRAAMIKSGDDLRLESWPNKEGVESLFAVPLFVGVGAVRGVLEFVNRRVTRDHPFSFLDHMEQEVASDVARTLAAVMEQMELSSRLSTATRIGAAGLFGAIVMHQLLTPFANMRGSIDWLMLHPNPSEEDRLKHLRRIDARVSEAVEIINHAAHRGAPGLQRVSLRAILQHALRVVEPEATFSAVSMRVNNEVRALIAVDLWSIVGAMVNLLSNAFDAMSDTDVLAVSTLLSPDGANGLIRIHNTGRVLSETEVVRFLQTGFTTKDDEAHLGLGLSLAKQAIKDAGGRLVMRPDPSGGLEVTVSFPLVDGRDGSKMPKGDENEAI